MTPRTRRRLWLAGAALTILAAVAGFLHFVQRPFRHPQTRFVFLAAESAGGLLAQPAGIPPRSIEVEREAWRRLESRLRGRPVAPGDLAPVPFRGPADVRQLGDWLSRQPASGGDVLLISLTATGLVEAGEPRLCWDFGVPTLGGSGRLAVRDVLQQILRSPARSIVVLLDAGEAPPSPEQGELVNSFPDALRRVVAEPPLADSRLWILCSHSTGEFSHRVGDPARSLFGVCVEQGLVGAADTDVDRLVSLWELHRYASATVAERVSRLTQGVASQSPQLLWGGGTSPQTLVHREQAARDCVVAPAPAMGLPDLGGVLSERPSAEPAAADAATESPSPPPSAAGSSSDPVAKLDSAWQIERHLRAEPAVGRSPVLRAPHLWQGFHRHLQVATALVATRSPLSTAEQAELDQWVSALRPLIDPEAPPTRFLDAEGARLARRVLAPRIGKGDWPSLALHEFNALDQGIPLTEPWREILERLDHCLAADERTEFDQWFAELSPAVKRLQELAGVTELSTTRDIDWPLLRGLLQTRRGESRVAARGLGRWELVASDVSNARRARREAERLLLDGLRPDRTMRAARWVEFAADRLAHAGELLASHDRAGEVARRVAPRVRDYIDWWRIACQDSLSGGPDAALLDDLLTSLTRLYELLERPGPTVVEELNRLTERLTEQQLQVESWMTPEAQAQLLASPAATTAALPAASRIRGLMATSLLEPVPLGRLAEWHRLFSQHLDTGTPEAGRPFPLDPGPVSPALALWRVERHARLVVQWARLAEPGQALVNPCGPSSSDADVRSPTDSPVDNLARLAGEFPGATWGESWRESWDLTWNDWVTGVQSKLRSLTRGDATPPTLRPVWRSLPRVLLFLPPSVSLGTTADDLLARSEQAAWRDWLLAQVSGLEESRQDSGPAELARLDWQESQFRGLLNLLGSEVWPVQSRISKFMSGPITLELAEEAESSAEMRVVTLTVRNSSPVEQPVWLLADYDPNLVDLTAPAGSWFNDVNELERLRPEWRRWERNGEESELLRGLPDSVVQTIAGRSEQKFTLQVMRRGARDWPTRVVLKAAVLVNGTAENAAPDCPPHSSVTLRQEVPLALPAAREYELSVVAPERLWSREGSGSVLYPFPNHRSPFQIVLRNLGKGREFDVRLYSLAQSPEQPVPEGPLDAGSAEAWLLKLQPLAQLGRVSRFAVPADGVPRAIPFTGPAPPEELAETRPVSPGDVKSSPQSGPLPGYAPAPGGLLWTVTDLGTGETLLHVCRLRVQRPSRYVRLRVEYLPEERILVVNLRRRPDGGANHPIDWQCELTRGLGDSTPRLVQARLLPQVAESQVTLAAIPGAETMFLKIAVDGFPRAFQYRIPPTQAAGEVEEETSLLAARIVSPADGALLPCPRSTVSAQVEIDAPQGAMPGQGAYWEIGLDRDRDRDLEQDVTLRFPTDRRIRTYVSGWTDDGRLVIDARAGDFVVEIPAAGVCNERPQLLVHAVVPEREAWSQPVEVTLDGEGPRVERVSLNGGRRMIAGEELEVAARATDGELSGVARVELAVDREGTGEFVKEPPPVVAARGLDGRWTARIPTAELKPGQYLLLLRGFDRVGNPGPITRQPLLLETQADLERDRAAQRMTLRGRVEYFGTSVPDVEVTLIPVEEGEGGGKTGQTPTKSAPEGKEAPGGKKERWTARTDAAGRFVVSRVPFGRYRLKAQGVFRNKQREVSREITVDESLSGQVGLLELP